jgi:hypothetical protein
VGPRAGLDAVVERKEFPAPAGNRNRPYIILYGCNEVQMYRDNTFRGKVLSCLQKQNHAHETS